MAGFFRKPIARVCRLVSMPFRAGATDMPGRGGTAPCREPFSSGQRSPSDTDSRALRLTRGRAERSLAMPHRSLKFLHAGLLAATAGLLIAAAPAAAQPYGGDGALTYLAPPD